MNYLWDTDAFLAATNGRPVGNVPEGCKGISIDTRTLKRGDAFFAIKGDKTDGHNYLAAAMKAGAAFAVVDENRLVSLGSINLPLVVVRDVLEAMINLGQVARMRAKAQIIAVTGSVGKTTAKEMLKTVLSASGPTHASVASYNNHWGVPLTLARMPEDTKYGIFEIGMNHPGEITPLVKMVRPHIAMIMNIAAAHIGAFETIDDIARAKAEIFSGVLPGGYGLINHDDRRYPLLKNLAGTAQIEHLLSFGEKRGSDFWLRDIEVTEHGSRISARHKGENMEFQIGVRGHHMAVNAIAVLGASILAGADIHKTKEAFNRVVPADGRGTIYHTGGTGALGMSIIDESYNANPASMKAALDVLANFDGFKTKRRIAVLGDMLELGNQSKKLHEGLAKPISAAKVDLVYLVGPEMEHLAKILPKEKVAAHFPDSSSLVKTLKKDMKPGDVLMFKASNSMRFSQIIQDLL